MRISILLTFDYELPLGACNSYDKGLFQPSEKILTLANELNVPIVLFADICSAIQFKKWDRTYYDSFKSQVQLALKDKHDVQLHIHPHWMNSAYENGKYIPSSDFGLSDFRSNTEYSIEDIITLAHQEMTTMCREVDPSYACIAFRAGGYNVEPESARILKALHQAGIRYESSVIQGLFQNYSFSKIDYRKAPNQNSWRVSLDGPLTAVTEQGEYLVEYPITSQPNSIGNILKRRMSKTIHNQEIKSREYNNAGKGYAAVSTKTNWLDSLRMAFNPIVLSFDRDYIELSDLERIVEYQVKKYASEEEIFITLISHPKSMGDYHIELMRQFILSMRDKYQDNLAFTTYSTLYKNQSK